jgi:hypothetical protein
MSLHFAFHLLPTAYCLLLTAYCLVLAAYCPPGLESRSAGWRIPTRGYGAVHRKLRVNLKRKSRSRHYASIMMIGFPKSKQFVELFEALKGIRNDGSAPQGAPRRFVYPAETLYS